MAIILYQLVYAIGSVTDTAFPPGVLVDTHCLGNTILDSGGIFTASTSAGTGHVNFPLAYSAACYSLALSTNDSGATIYRCTPSGINTTGFYYVMTSTEAKEARYICIGK